MKKSNLQKYMYAQKHMYKDIQCTTVYKIRNSNQKEELTTFWHIPYNGQQFPGGSTGKESAYNARDLGSIPGLGRSPARGHSNSLQYCEC